MDKFPSWLPKEVKAHADHLIAVGGLNSSKPLLMRLVAHKDMQKVWNRLTRNSKQAQQLIDFLEYVRLHASLQGEVTSSISIPSDKVQRAAFHKITNAAETILQTLKDLSQSDDPQQGWRLVESALRRAELDAAAQGASATLITIMRIQSSLQAVQQKGAIVTIMDSIASATDFAAMAPDMALPKRRSTKRAKCNLLILDLKTYLKMHFSLTHSDALIAVIVNAAFQFKNVIITADDVRKLKT